MVTMKERVALGALVTFFTVATLLFALMDYVHHRESNRCEMSYMFHTPVLHSLSLIPPPPPRLAGYQLFYYCSGQCRPFATENGLPILFLPGTRGSFKTIRSLASVQDYFQGNKEFQFDFFALDFNEETTALSGNLIERQAEYLQLSVDGILSLYAESENRPTSVMIVGHSLGILAAVHLLSDPQFDQSKITTVISLAGPLLDPIYSPGPVMDRVYRRVSAYFKAIAADPTHPLVIVSLTGGSRDILVSDTLGALDRDAPGSKLLWLSTSSISRVWASCDHLCILWCRQLMHALTFTLQDLKLLSLATDRLNASTRLRVFRDRFISVPVGLDRTLPAESTTPATPIQVDRLPPGQWVYRTNQQAFRYTGILPAEGQFTKIGPFFDDQEQRVLVTTNHVFGDWLFICVDPKRSSFFTDASADDEHPCSQLIPVSKRYVTWVPQYGSAFARGLALLTVPATANFSPGVEAGARHHPRSGLMRQGVYLVVAHPPPAYPNSQVELVLETFTDWEQRVHHIPTDSHIPWHHPMRLELNRARSRVVGSDVFLSVFHRICFPADRFLFSPSLAAPRLTVTNIQCSEPTSGGQGLMAFYAPWANYFYHSFISEDSLNTLDLDVPIPQPDATTNASLFVDLILTPYCTYTISIHLSLFQWIAKLLRLHWAHLFGLICAHFVLELYLVTWSLFDRSDCHSQPRGNRDLCADTIGVGPLNESVPMPTKTTAESSSTMQPGRKCSLTGLGSASLAPDPSYTRSLGLHLLAVGLLSLSLQVTDCKWSDWTRLYDYGHLGLRLLNPNHHPSPELPLSVRLVAHLPFLLIAVSVGLLMPMLIRLCSAILLIAMRCSVFLSRPLHSWQFRCSNWMNSNLPVLGLFVLGLVTCEAFGVLLFAAHMFLKVYMCLHVQSVWHTASSSDKKKTTGKSDSTFSHSRSHIPFSHRLFYWHCIVLIITVLVSLFLIENWMEFLQAIDQYRKAGYQHIELLFHNPVQSIDWHATFVLGATALVDLHHGQLADRFWPLASASNRTQSVRLTCSLPVAIFLSGICFICLAGLFHTAILGYRLALLSAWAMQSVLCVARCHTVCELRTRVRSVTDAVDDVKSKSD